LGNTGTQNGKIGASVGMGPAQVWDNKPPYDTR